MPEIADTFRPHVRIQAAAGTAGHYLRECMPTGASLLFLAWRDIKVRYKQTALGAAWAIIQPFFTMVVFTVFFGKLAKVPSDGLPYPVFAFAALLPWQLFAFALSQSSGSLVAGANLLRKVYFPRLIIPASSVVAGLVDFAIAFLVLLGLMAYYGIAPGAAIVYLPAFTALAVLTALAAGLWLSALNVKYRDVRYAIPFITQFWLFLSPVAYSTSLLPEQWRWIYGLNPMAGVIEGFRWCLLGREADFGVLTAVSACVVLIAFVTGVIHFRRTERFFADIV